MSQLLPTKGKAPEIYVCMRLLQHGLTPFVPVLDDRGVDMIAMDERQQCFRLQVKSRTFKLPEKGSFGEQIKKLLRGRDQLAFDFLAVVLPSDKDHGTDYEAWVVPRDRVKERLSPRGDLTLSVKLLRGDWKDTFENWGLIGRNDG